MKFISVFAVILGSCGLTLSRSHARDGYKEKGDECDFKLFGSECKDGLKCLENNCGMNKCLVPTGGVCTTHLDCDYKHICTGGKCTAIPDLEAENGRDTQVLMEIPAALKFLRSNCKNLIKPRLWDECSQGFIYGDNCNDHLKCEKLICHGGYQGEYRCVKKRGEKCKEHKECGPEEHCRDGKCSGLPFGVKDQWEAGFTKPSDKCPEPNSFISWEKIVNAKWEDVFKMDSVTVHTEPKPSKKSGKRRKY
jgi:hypothetical protein